MFTIEMDWDETAVQVLDQTGEYEDVEYILYDDIVYIRQWDEDLQKYSVIAMTADMFRDFSFALDLPEGAYITERKTDD
ncbi:MAG: hypothetical protein HOM88_05330 [Hellea sp.]|jgi:hypothetical protein|nr:hypothetical protein [Hellea sp.]